MSSTTTPLIYAELLSNIRQISVLAALPSSSDAQTTVSLSPDRKLLKLLHSGTTTSLHLPAQISASYIPSQPAPGLQELSWRIPLDTSGLQARPGNTDIPPAPWSASELSSSSSFSCRKCDQVLLPAGHISTWQDLPSENWAEMMDFWHCHKPSEPASKDTTDGDANLASKGYGANTRFMGQKGVGKVDVTYFLLSSEDCTGIEVHPAPFTLPSRPTLPPQPLTCTTCAAQLGTFDPSVDGYRLLKWSLTLTHTSPPSSSAPPLPHFLLPHLHTLTSTLAVSKFIIRGPPSSSSEPSPPPTNIYTWLFAPTLTIAFSSPASAAPPPPPIPSAKLLFQPLTAAQADALLDAPNSPIEEVRVPAATALELLDLLTASNARLPAAARHFAGWEVGVLERGAGDP